MAEVPDRHTWSIPTIERLTRVDFTRDPYYVMSIDPPGCTDVDDALHAFQLPTGGYQVGVHIADVAYFVQEGGAMDAEARSRGTTAYLVDRRINMLPEHVSEWIASLRGGEERLSMSMVTWLDEDFNVVGTWLGRGIIRSKHQLTYY